MGTSADEIHSLGFHRTQNFVGNWVCSGVAVGAVHHFYYVGPRELGGGKGGTGIRSST